MIRARGARWQDRIERRELDDRGVVVWEPRRGRRGKRVLVEDFFDIGEPGGNPVENLAHAVETEIGKSNNLTKEKGA